MTSLKHSMKGSQTHSVPWSHDLLCPMALPFPALGHELLMINLQQDIEYTSFVTQTTGIIFCAWVSCVHFLN